MFSEYWGRRPTLWYSFWGGLIFTALMLICFGAVVLYIELFIVVNMYAIAIATVWLYTPECYPTYLRLVLEPPLQSLLPFLMFKHT